MYVCAGVGKTTLCSSYVCLCWYCKYNVVFKFVMYVYAGIVNTTLCSSLLCRSMLVIERQRCVQVCYVFLCWCWKDNVVFKFVMYVSCLCWCWKNNVVFKFVMHGYAGIRKTTLCSSLL